jgi:hypothetical protein
VELLKEGLIWRIGDGESVNIWEDSWLPRGSTRRPITPRGASLLSRVSELINPVTGEWDEQLLRDTFWPEDVDEILQILIDLDVADCPASHYDAKGIFSVKSAYKLADARRDTKTGQDASSSEVKGENGGSFDWYKIW